MNTITSILEVSKRVAVIAALILLCVLLLRLGTFVDSLDKAAANLNGGISDARIAIGNTDKSLNGTEAQRGKDGLLFAAKKGIDDVRSGAVIASRQEQQYYAGLKVKTDETFAHLNTVLVASGDTIKHIDKTQATFAQDAHLAVIHLDGALDSIPAVMEQTQKAIATVDRVAGDPSITSALKHIDVTSEHVEAIAANGALVAYDLQGTVHQATHPSKLHLILGGIWTAAKIIATRAPF